MADANIIVIGGNADDQDHDIPDNTNPAWRVHQGGTDYIAIATTNSAECVKLVSSGTGRVSIGTHDPYTNIDAAADNLVVGDGSGDEGITIVSGSNAGDYGSIYFGDPSSGTQGQIRYEQNNEVMSFHTNTAERMRIDLNGSVLIGADATAAAASTVTIQANSSAAQALGILGRSADDISEINFYENDKSTRLGEIQFRQTLVNIRHRVGDIIFCAGGVAESMRIDSGGDVGIGTSSPASKLHVKRTDGSTHDAIIVSQVESTVGNTQFRCTGVATETNGAYGFGRWGAGAVFVNSDNTAGNYTGFQNINADGYGNCGINFVNKAHGTSTTEGEIHFYTRASGGGYAEAGRWDEQGNLGVGVTNPAHAIDVSGTAGLSTGTAWTNTSDSRVKQNVETIENALEKIEALRPVSFEYTQDYVDCTDGIVAGQRYNSFIAQEYAEVFPDAVSVGPDLVKESPEEEPVVLLSDLKQFTPHDLNMYLVRAVQELSAQIKELKGGN